MDIKSFKQSMKNSAHSITGILFSSELDKSVFLFRFTDSSQNIVTGNLHLSEDLIQEVNETGNKIFFDGIYYPEIILTFKEKASIPVDIFNRFIKSLLEFYSATNEKLHLTNIIDDEIRPNIKPKCTYHGCGGDDSWPRV